MLNEPAVSGSTLTPTPNLKVRTDSLRPLAWMVFVFISSCFGLFAGVTYLKQFQPPQSPTWNQFLLTEGTHRWIIQGNQQCDGYVVGGWKKSKKIGEWIWFKFKMRAQANLAEQTGVIRAKFGDYKNLTALSGILNGREISFDGTNWSGFVSPPRELLLLVDTRNEKKQLRIPSPWNREFESILGEYINDKRKLVEVEKDRFLKCVKELQP